MAKKAMSDKEQELYLYILEYRQKMRFSPSMREIADDMGFKSVATVHHHIHNLIDKGWLMSYVGRRRSLIPTAEERIL